MEHVNSLFAFCVNVVLVDVGITGSMTMLYIDDRRNHLKHSSLHISGD